MLVCDVCVACDVYVFHDAPYGAWYDVHYGAWYGVLQV